MQCKSFFCLMFNLTLYVLANSLIQVNVGQLKKVTGVVVQGCPASDNWVTKFRIQSSTDGVTWTDYTSDGGVSTSIVFKSGKSYLMSYETHKELCSIESLNII